MMLAPSPPPSPGRWPTSPGRRSTQRQLAAEQQRAQAEAQAAAAWELEQQQEQQAVVAALANEARPDLPPAGVAPNAEHGFTIELGANLTAKLAHGTSVSKSGDAAEKSASRTRGTRCAFFFFILIFVLRTGFCFCAASPLFGTS